MDAQVRDNILSGCPQANPGLHADTSRVAASLQTLPDDLFTAITALLLAPSDRMYSQLGAARAIACPGQTSHHFRVAMQRVWPVRRCDVPQEVECETTHPKAFG